MGPGDITALTKARADYARGNVMEAHEIYHRLSDQLEDPEDLARYAKSCLMAGDITTASLSFERAFEASMQSDSPGIGAEAALWRLRTHMDRGERAQGMSWMRRAERLLENCDVCSGHAELRVLQAFAANLEGKLELALQLACEAESLARQVGAETPLTLALNRQGRVLLRLGRVDEGQALIDEAMARVTLGLTDPAAGFIVYCSTIDAYTDIADFTRASEWTDAANDWCDRYRVQGAHGICRIHRAELLRLRGDWEMAEREIVEACANLQRQRLTMASAFGLGELGMLRLVSGALDEAEAAFQTAHGLGHEAQPGLALLRLKRGNAAGAAACIARALEEVPDDPLPRSKLLPAQVEIALAHGTPEVARQATNEMREIAVRFPTSGMQAAAAFAEGQILLHDGDVGGAISRLRKSLHLWKGIGAPYEMARIRRLLAEAHEREGDLDQAHLERGSAERAFATLGATHDLLTLRPPASAAISPLAATVLGEMSPKSPAPFPAIDSVARVSATSGTLIAGKILLEQVLGAGAMGEVFAATNQMTGRRVAVKLVSPVLAREGDYCERLLQEARACGRIRHPHVVDVYDAGVHDGLPYIVLELLEGETVAARLKRSRLLPWDEVLAIVLQALDGVHEAHRQNVIHRDLKPENLFLCRTTTPPGWTVKVVDFGISKCSQSALAATQPGALLGTPYYMAPEQFDGCTHVDARTDIYAMGVVLFELLTGSPPFIATTYSTLLRKILHEPFPSIAERVPGSPPGLDGVLARSTARHPGDRYASAQEFAAALRSFATP